MITITQGQSPKDNPDLVVVSPSGSYDENDIIMCAYLGSEDPVCGYEAQYVKNGNAAYNQPIIPT